LIDFKKPYDSVRREVLHSVLIEFGVPMKLVRLIKMCLNETYNKAHISKCHISYPKWSKIRRCFLAIAFQQCPRMCHYEVEIKWDISAVGLY
jgi:hypothetical protein